MGKLLLDITYGTNIDSTFGKILWLFSRDIKGDGRQDWNYCSVVGKQFFFCFILRLIKENVILFSISGFSITYTYTN